MKITSSFYTILIFLILIISVNCSKKEVNPTSSIEGFVEPINNSRDRLFDSGWLFHRGDTDGAEKYSYNDFRWRKVDVPHDWSIEDVPKTQDSSAIGPFSKKSQGKSYMGHTIGGIGWYRKHFSIKKVDEGKKFTILFDGIYMNSEVWINGNYLGKRPSGYSAFYYDLTPFLKPVGEDNIIAVKASNQGFNSRWYPGSGIYRHVHLIVTDKMHILPWGIKVRTPNVSDEKAIINIAVQVLSESIDNNSTEGIKIKTIIHDPNGKEVVVKQTKCPISQKLEKTVIQNLQIKNPLLWSDISPKMYKANIQVWNGDKKIDDKNVDFGIRSIEFSSKKGLLVNGKSVKLRGGNLHHDNGILGSAAYDRAEQRKLEILKANGYNAVRTSHNPPSTSFLNACDRLGIYVIDEAFDVWKEPKKPHDFHLYFQEWWERDLEAMINRDKNHPSIIAWSVGNEVPQGDSKWFYAMTDSLMRKANVLDNSRPSTQAICCFEKYERDELQKTFSLSKIQSYNYQWSEYEEDKKDYPDRIIIGSETFPDKAFENEMIMQKHPWVIGNFVWTAMDYFGEAGIGKYIIKEKGEDESYPPISDWPRINAWCGDIDICGFKKPQSYYRDVLWEESMIEIAVHAPIAKDSFEITSLWGWPNEQNHWSWPNSKGEKLTVNVYSRSDKVRLELNGRIIGTRKVSEETKFIATFEVQYEEGLLQAKGFNNGVEVSRKELKTAGRAVAIKLTPDRSKIAANKNDMSFVEATFIDENGIRVPNVNDKIEFFVSDNGELIACGNSDPEDVQSFHDGETHTFQGRCLAIIRAREKKGTITLTAKAEGILPAQIEIIVQ